MQRIPLSPQSWLEFHPDFLALSAASELQRQLVQKLHWESRAIRLFGKDVLQPRLVSWCGAEPYTYSGQTLEPRETPTFLKAVLSEASLAANNPFNHILLNRYRDGKDSMGLHTDNERELGPAPIVATLSLGAERKFIIRNRKREVIWQAALSHGSLLVMAGACQQEFKHELPKQPKLTEERISLTFRRILSPTPT